MNKIIVKKGGISKLQKGLQKKVEQNLKQSYL